MAWEQGRTVTVERMGEWDVIARKTNRQFGTVMNVLARLLFVIPERPDHSTVTWTVRNAQTGETRTITANSEEEFAQRLAAGVFD
jgi:hypothetical protein